MDLKRLRTFVTVADLGGVSAASAALAITQPALSRQIKDLEAELGLRLFEQIGRRLRLTTEGAELLTASRTLLRQAEGLVEQARSLSQGDSGELRVGATPHTIANVFPGFLRDFARQYPRLRITTIEAGGITQRDLLLRGELHAACAVTEGEQEGFISHRLPPLQILAACHPRWDMLAHPRVEVSNLASLPLLLLKPGYGTRKVFDAACRLERVHPHVVIESSAPETLLALAREGQGIAIVPASARIDRESLMLRPLHLRDAPLTVEIAVLWNRERMLPRYATAFTATFAANLQTAIARALAD